MFWSPKRSKEQAREEAIRRREYFARGGQIHRYPMDAEGERPDYANRLAVTTERIRRERLAKEGNTDDEYEND